MKQATIWRNFRVFVAAKFKSEEEPMTRGRFLPLRSTGNGGCPGGFPESWGYFHSWMVNGHRKVAMVNDLWLNMINNLSIYIYNIFIPSTMMVSIVMGVPQNAFFHGKSEDRMNDD